MKTYHISKIKNIAILASIILLVSSCRFGLNDPMPLNQSNIVIEEPIPLTNFDRIQTENAFNIFVRKGSNFSIVAKGDQYDLADLEALVNKSELKIRYKNFLKNRYQMNIHITMPHLVGVDFSGATIAEIYNFNENKILIFAKGASDIYIDSDAKTWQGDISSGTYLEIVGNGHSFQLNATGASDVKGTNLYVDTIDLNISGASTAQLFAYDQIIGKASGASLIEYRGNPLVDIHLSGSSRVTKN